MLLVPSNPGCATQDLEIISNKDTQSWSYRISIPSRGTKYSWPFKWALGCYPFMPACSILFLPKSNWNRQTSGLIRHIKCSLYHLWRWFCWLVNAQSRLQSNNKWACSHSLSLPAPLSPETRSFNLKQDQKILLAMETNEAQGLL